ncbi:MAG: ubiquinol-cytochrome c reductase iron-sulfur subunit [Rhodospirillaceae bacterium]|jgi:ubiquinol-cytochrome c reductase iron-sulfur subunit|nr:ubiquinol-cytochrome c reductase iron-sulfur subunit [Rhodospirillaceae bacterium]MBT5457022.1 ubiquinol-cytochrome c reductase iron-sulfur subunit [Rhodospirillaceae bacterium]
MASIADTTATGDDDHENGETRRDFLLLTAGAFGAVAVGAAVWPLVDQMNPAADTLAASTTEVNLAPIKAGQRILVKWRGKPVFITRRTKKTIDEARAVKMADLVDPQSDEDRARKPEWLIIVGVCTHLGCIPAGTKQGELRGEYGGWFCPCHGSHYDTSGRIRKGPAPENLPVPDYAFLPGNKIIIGKSQAEIDKASKVAG